MKHKLCYFISCILLFGLIIKEGSFANKFLTSGIKKFYKKPLLRYTVINSYNNSDLNSVIYNILKERYNLKRDDINYDIIIDSVYGNEPIKDKKGIKIFYTSEAAIPNFDDYDLIIGFNRIVHSKYFRLPYYQITNIKNKLNTKKNMRAEFGKCAPDKKKLFACILVSNGCTGNNWHIGNNMPFDGVIARDKLLNNLSLYKKVASGGKHLNNIEKIIRHEDTINWLSQCKFVIAYENQSFDGYITEKPFNAYFSGAIPIYYSSKSAVQDINKKAIIYAGDYQSEQELIEYIKKVDNDNKLYCDIWNENIINNPNVNHKTVVKNLRKKLFEILDQKLSK